MKPEIVQTQSWRYKTIAVIKCQQQNTTSKKNQNSLTNWTSIRIQETHLSNKYQPAITNYIIIRKARPPHLGRGGMREAVSRLFRDPRMISTNICPSDIRLAASRIQPSQQLF